MLSATSLWASMTWALPEPELGPDRVERHADADVAGAGRERAGPADAVDVHVAGAGLEAGVPAHVRTPTSPEPVSMEASPSMSSNHVASRT